MPLIDKIGASRRQVVLAGGILVLLLALLLALYVTVLRSPYKVLFSDLRPAEAATVIAELEQTKTPYRLSDEGRTILVPAHLADAARISVEGQDLPLTGTVGFELFNKSDMGLTEFAQQINYRRALQGELARTIMTLEGLESARVHLTLPDTAVFRQDRRPAKASVTLIPRKDYLLEPATVEGVRRLVAAAVADLDVASVVILDSRGVVISTEVASQRISAPDASAYGLDGIYGEAVRLALRDYLSPRTVEVVITAPPSAQAMLGSGEFSPEARDFPIRVQVLIEGPLTADQEGQARQLAILAARLDPALGDSLLITPLPPLNASPPVATPQAPAAQSPSPTTASEEIGWLAAAMFGGALLILLLLGWRSRQAAEYRRLTPDQKTDYVARLRRLLEEPAGGV